MKVKHVFGGHVYLISNYGVARNPIFKDETDLAFFKQKFDDYLGEICDVFAKGHKINQFQYLIKIKDRKDLEAFYLRKLEKKKKNIAHDLYQQKVKEIPASYLIFSQEVSNFLNCVAKKFNFRHGRQGSLFGDRYGKFLVESEEEMVRWMNRLEVLEPLVTFEEEWCAEECNNSESEVLESSSVSALGIVKQNLRGCFNALPPSSVKSSSFLLKFQNYIKIHGSNPPW